MDFLNELLFLFDAKRVLLKEFHVTETGGGKLKAVVKGEAIDLDPARDKDAGEGGDISYAEGGTDAGRI